LSGERTCGSVGLHQRTGGQVMKILVGVDGGTQQPSALLLASELAGIEEAELVLAHVVPSWRRPPETAAAASGEAIGAQDGVLRAAADALGPTPAETRLVRGLSARRGLHRVAEDEETALMVIGSCHQHAVGRVLSGGTSDGILNGAPCAVAVAPPGYEPPPEGMRRIAVAYDGGPESRTALAWAWHLAERLGGRLTLLRVVESVLDAAYPGAAGPALGKVLERVHRAARRDLRRAITRLPAELEPRGELLEGAPALSLTRAAGEHDLLVAGSRGHGSMGSLLLGSVSHGLMHRVERPLVLVPRGAGGRPEGAGTMLEKAGNRA
jgi:nucleotide-binding universal stress UspA family protein